MTFSIKQMEDRTERLRIRRDTLSGAGINSVDLVAVIRDMDEALEVIAELSGRLSAAEELLATARHDIRSMSSGCPRDD